MSAIQRPLDFIRPSFPWDRSGAAGDYRGQAGDLLECQAGHILAEPAMRCGLDAVNPGTEFDDVQIMMEDPVLAERFFQPGGDQELADLTGERFAGSSC